MECAQVPACVPRVLDLGGNDVEVLPDTLGALPNLVSCG